MNLERDDARAMARGTERGRRPGRFRIAACLVCLLLGAAPPSGAQTLKSSKFSGDPQLEAAAVSNPAHVLPGARGAHVGKLQRALIETDASVISPQEIIEQRYGETTAKAVLDYKTKRSIINRAYQATADNVVGIMTMQSLDREMRAIERGQFTKEEAASILGPPISDPIPGFDIVAPDGFVIPLPREIRTGPGRTKLLDHATVNVFMNGATYVVVVDALDSSGPHPNTTTAAKAAAGAVAKRAATQGLKYQPVPGRVIAFGAGKVAGGAVSVVASVLDPSPLAREAIWHVELSGKHVSYHVLF